MKKLARISALHYVAYGLFCLVFSVLVAATTGFVYAVKNGLYDDNIGKTLSNMDEFLVSIRYGLGTVAVSCAVGALLLLIFVLMGVGYEKGSNKIHLRLVDRIYYEIVIAFCGGVVYLITRLCVTTLNNAGYWNIFVVVPALLIGSLILEETIISGAIRYKAGVLVKKTLLYRIFLLFRDAYVNFALIWKAVFIILIYFVTTFVTFYFDYPILLALWVIITFIYCAIIGSCVIFIDTLGKGAKKMAEGNLNYKVNTTGMYSEFTKLATYLNNMGDGFQKAVDEKTKSDRLRTELITNVSHDIKTPLTSIINYVDLLKRENITEEEKKQYLDVLERQTAKLKKLILDLVEASKAITGNISVNAAPMNINELLNQAIGEYSEKFGEKSLEPVITMPESGVSVIADGRLVWRIFDNLMSNICKYSLEKTRVYIDISKSGESVSVVFKNISKSVLNVSADELLERFVRGDTSRSTEGSGLGLSVAQSLAEAQNGKLEISVDGDLFKCVLTLTACESISEAE